MSRPFGSPGFASHGHHRGTDRNKTGPAESVIPGVHKRDSGLGRALHEASVHEAEQPGPRWVFSGRPRGQVCAGCGYQSTKYVEDECCVGEHKYPPYEEE